MVSFTWHATTSSRINIKLPKCWSSPFPSLTSHKTKITVLHGYRILVHRNRKFQIVKISCKLTTADSLPLWGHVGGCKTIWRNAFVKRLEREAAFPYKFWKSFISTWCTLTEKRQKRQKEKCWATFVFRRFLHGLVKETTNFKKKKTVSIAFQAIFVLHFPHKRPVVLTPFFVCAGLCRLCLPPAKKNGRQRT